MTDSSVAITAEDAEGAEDTLVFKTLRVLRVLCG